MTLDIRPITPDEYRNFMVAEGIAFGGRPSDADLEQRRATFELDRSLAAFEDGQIVATAGAYSFDLTLPGGATLAVPGVSWVGVLPTHRRRGLLNAMMSHQLEGYAQAGYPLAMLTASESAIYGRFGYGVASSTASFELSRAYNRLANAPAQPGRVRILEQDAAIDALSTVYERLRPRQPGALTRSRAYWEWLMANSYGTSEGFGGRLYIAYEAPSGEIEGAAHYRIKSEWTNGVPNGTLLIRELYAATPAAQAALWSYCLNVDLVTTVRAMSRPIDEPLRWMLADPRRLRITALNDDLWLRILDVPTALAARRYAAADHLVLEVTDIFRPATSGRYALDASIDDVSCQRTDDAPDLSLTIADLGAAYLGGVTWSTLAAAGRVREQNEGALRRADALFFADRAPYCATPF
jgi:predicted acetyltransferase